MAWRTPLPKGLKLLPALIATGAYVGRIPFAPGTWGSLLAVLLAIPFLQLPFAYLLGASLVAFIAGLWASAEWQKQDAKSDPQSIVIDEIAGQWLVLAFIGTAWLEVVLAFVLFRLCDISKPFPARQAERLHGAWGIMLDDIIAALWAIALLWLLRQYVPL